MKITVSKIKRELVKKGWKIDKEDEVKNFLIRDTLIVIDNILKTHKNISIK